MGTVRTGFVWMGDGDIVCARVKKETAGSLKAENFHDFLDQLVEKLPKKTVDMELAKYQWDVVLKNGKVIDSDFEISGRSGIEGSFHEDSSVYGPEDRLYIAKGAEIHPQVVIDTNHGSVTIEEGAIVFPHSRIEGPCYIGKDTQITRGNIREGCSFGPVCRVGGEVEEAVIHAYSNKYHDGFLGHAYVCEWVNLGALTTNSDLKNDYGSVEVYMQRDDGTFSYVDSGSTKVGSFIGDHTKTSIGVFLNTGSNVGVMTLLMSTGGVLPKHIPSFAWYLEGAITGGFGYKKLKETAEIVTTRRGRPLTDADRALLDYVYEMTMEERKRLIKKDRKKLLRK